MGIIRRQATLLKYFTEFNFKIQGGLILYTLNAQQQKNVLDSFQQVVDKRSSRYISEDLYNHLNLNCNFLSHFGLQGFRDAYSDDHFQEFLDHFVPHSLHSQWQEAPEISREFFDLNRALIDYANPKSSELINGRNNAPLKKCSVENH